MCAVPPPCPPLPLSQGDIIEILAWNVTFSAADMAAVEVCARSPPSLTCLFTNPPISPQTHQSYFASTYYLYCPSVPASPSYALSTSCSGTKIGDMSVCLVTCTLPLVRVAGGSTVPLWRFSLRGSSSPY